MQVVVSERVTLEGFTYQPGEHEVSERIGKKLIHNWPDSVNEKPKRRKRKLAKVRVVPKAVATKQEAAATE